jgi:hypothetical protein
MMETEKVSRTLDGKSRHTWLIIQKDFIAGMTYNYKIMAVRLNGYETAGMASLLQGVYLIMESSTPEMRK